MILAKRPRRVTYNIDRLWYVIFYRPRIKNIFWGRCDTCFYITPYRRRNNSAKSKLGFYIVARLRNYVCQTKRIPFAQPRLSTKRLISSKIVNQNCQLYFKIYPYYLLFLSFCMCFGNYDILRSAFPFLLIFPWKFNEKTYKKRNSR